ncbi:MAG: glycosyltransferase family 39 protein [Candidatus Acidiferrum sp.]
MKHIPNILAVFLLLLMAFLAGGAALRESITIDEVAHLGAGVSYLQKLDLRMNQEHPPLAKAIAAIPLVFRGVRADYSDISWTFSGQSVFGSFLGEWPWGHAVALRWNDPYPTVLWGRVPMLLLTLALGVSIYLFASKLGNPWGGVLCLAAYVSTPAFLVFGPLILTDIPVAFFSLLTLWSFASLWRSPSRGGLVRFGLLFGAAILSKFSAGALLFCFLAFRLSLRFAPVSEMPAAQADLKEWRRLRARYLWKGIFLAAMTVYAVYFVLSWNQSSDSLSGLGHNPAALLLRRLLLPAWLFLRGLGVFALSSSRATFILGHAYSHGVWFYFPIVFLLKSTLAFLLMLLLTLLVGVVARRKLRSAAWIPGQMEFHWRAIWTCLLVFVAFCMLSRMTISIRHFTIPLMLLILLMAPAPRALALLRQNGWRPARFAMAAYFVLALASVVTMVRAYPYFFPFLNSLSFGHPAYALVSDSNLDWNQSLPEVQRFAQERGLSRILIDEYGYNDPTVYVPQAQFWDCQIPSPPDAGQWAAVSADMIQDSHNCLWLMNFPHITLAGGSMYAFQLPPVLPEAGELNGPPPATARRSFAGFNMGDKDTRLIFLDCVRDPNLLQPTLDGLIAEFKARRKKN